MCEWESLEKVYEREIERRDLVKGRFTGKKKGSHGFGFAPAGKWNQKSENLVSPNNF